MGIFSKFFGSREQSPEPINAQPRKDTRPTLTVKGDQFTPEFRALVNKAAKRKGMTQAEFVADTLLREASRNQELEVVQAFESLEQKRNHLENLEFIRGARPEYKSNLDAEVATGEWAKASIQRKLESQRPQATEAQSHVAKISTQSAALPPIPTLDTMDSDELAERICVCEKVLADGHVASILRRQWARQAGALTRLREIALSGASEHMEWRHTAAYIPALDAYYSPTKGAIRPKGSKAWEPIDAKKLAEKIKGAC